jgi:polyisoprenoid-binding protein YceI
MKKSILTFVAVSMLAFTGFSQDAKLVTKTAHISFFSHTVAEDITANNYAVTSTLNPTSGEVVFSVPMQSFEFEKAAMQKHYNSEKFLDTKQFPKAKFKVTISNLTDVDFSKDGTYDAKITADLTIHGVTKSVTESGSVTVAGDKITVNAKLNIILADHEIAFEKGKPSTNIAKTIEATIKAEYTK